MFVGLESIFKEAVEVKAEDFTSLIDNVIDIVKKEEIDYAEIRNGLVTLEPRGKSIVIGDIHGDSYTLREILETSKLTTYLKNEGKLICLGDYGDRGFDSLTVYYILLKLKELNSRKIILLIGNHEGAFKIPVHPHDIIEQIYLRFGEEYSEIYEKLITLWSYLPYTVIIPGKYILLHGGVPAELNSIDEIPEAREKYPLNSMFEEILWSDPIDEVGVYPSPRGAGKLFGPDITRKALNIVNAKTLIRSHEPCIEGVEPKQENLTLTVFSCKGIYYNRNAAYLIVNLEEEAKNSYELAMKAVKL
ncbi:MAG: metallophosphoesterase family protein [Candidatus Methanomethylicia archaeon]